MYSDEIARLTGTLKFEVDKTGFRDFQRYLDNLERRLANFRKVADKKLGIKPAGMQVMTKQIKEQQALTKAQFTQQMQASKFTLANAKAETQLAQQRTKQSLLESKQKRADLQFSLQAEKAMHQLRQQAARTAAAEARSKTALGRLAAFEQDRQYKLDQRRARDLKRQQQRSSVSSGHRLPHFGGGGLGGFAGRMSLGPIVAPSMGGIAGAAGGATVALAALAAAAVAASNAFAEAAQRAGDTRDTRLAQFKAMTGSREGALGAESRYLELANKLGLDAAQGGRDYAKLTGALSRKVGVEQAEATAAGILSYGKSQGSTGEELQGLNRGLLQALGKNQLFSEEWTGQIAEHLGARANEFGAEAYQRAIGGNKTGQAAEDQFRKDREDRKIAGKTLQTFLVELGNILGKHANDGGALDIAVNTGESSRARMENQLQASLAHSYDANDSKLRNQVALFNKAKFDLLQGLGPEFDKFGSLAADTLAIITSVINKTTEFVNAVNQGDLSGFFDKDSLQEFQDSFGELSTEFHEQLEQIGILWSAIWGDTTPKDVGSFVLDVLSKVTQGMATVFDVSQSILGVITDIVEKIRAAAETLGIVEKRKANKDGISGNADRIQGQMTPIPRSEEEANRIQRGLMPNLDGAAIPRAGADFIPQWMKGITAANIPDYNATGIAAANASSQTVNTTTNTDNSVKNDIVQNINVEVKVPDNVATVQGMKDFLERDLDRAIKNGAERVWFDQLSRAAARQKEK